MIDAALLLVMGVLYAVGVYLILEKSLTKVLLGLMLITNATNILILHTGGVSGLPAFFDSEVAAADYFDPLPQALVLTAIVISFSVTALMLGMIYRSWVLSRRDDIQDDAEDRRVVHVQLTEEGLAFVDRVSQAHFANENRMLRGLTATERERLADLLSRLEASLDHAAAEQQ